MALSLFRICARTFNTPIRSTLVCNAKNVHERSCVRNLHATKASMFPSTTGQSFTPVKQEVLTDDLPKEEKRFADETIALVNNQIKENKEGRLFAVIHVAGKQFKVTSEDIIIVHGHWDPKPGNVIEFEKVLMVGGKDFSLLGRPVLPVGLVTVKGTIVEKDLSHTKTHFNLFRRKQHRRINFIRSEHTMIRINEIKIGGEVGAIENEEGVRRIER
ncbi:39S ribosomal protein L21, mitochondrial [Nilaparvata lugens]|uniref:39S ribosomal protein L21, mitochondrial n=1 Tax=Nilaparvata lugens TaxID=108931 RepID=UPI00193D21DA|nr:39S ribosomal protein L21, mitochondrial [Nilaparvata lugens]